MNFLQFLLAPLIFVSQSTPQFVVVTQYPAIFMHLVLTQKLERLQLLIIKLDL